MSVSPILPFVPRSKERFRPALGTKTKMRLTEAVLVLLLGVAAVVWAVVEFDPQPNNRKFSVLRASTDDLDQLIALRALYEKSHQFELDFWLTPMAVGHKADIMVPDSQLEWLSETLRANNITYDVTIDDVERLIMQRERKPRRLNFEKRLNSENSNRARYAFGEYHSYDTIVGYMRDVERKYPDRAKVFDMGTTHEGRSIYGIKIGKDVSRTDKRIFWIDGGIHAREWAAVHTVVYFIDRLIADYDEDPIVRSSIENIHFYIIPVLNPDGYEFSRSDISPMVRLWRKNRAGVFCKKDRWFRDRCCGGVDLNRNFDWFFGELGSSDEKCSEIYQGSGPFSEAESRAVRDLMLSKEVKGKVDAFLTLHTYSQMWIHPYSHQRKTVPEDIREIEEVGRAAVSALEKTFGTRYRFGTGADILYPSAGGSDDWAKGKGGAKYVYLVELRPGEEVWDGFILDQRQLIPTAKETWNGIRVVAKAVLDRVPRSTESVRIPSTSTSTSTTSETTTTATNSTREATTSEATTTGSTTTTTTTLEPILEAPVSDTPLFAPSTPAPLLDVSYVLGKRRFKFVSIGTFVYTTAPPTALLSPPLHDVTDDVVLVEHDSEADDEEVEGARLTPVATSARRPRPTSQNRAVIVNNSRSSTIAQRLRQRQRIGRIRNTSRPRIGGTSRGSTEVNGGRSATVTSLVCLDKSPWCAAWRSTTPDVCRISSIYMRRDCARTCGFCAA
ncbi:unnamed protein product [Caenorhabditis auriculariae]|uniref:ShKT domain-containing protein n=1 Tax=Caenorhabditis auriculariae TaxID=2777116 RepID=A0A8S1GN18_9PELO|nr:unnamed protein product [Caenorhabditis auriculariae]